MKNYISVSQAAKKLNVSVQTIYNMCKTGKLGGICIKSQTKNKWLIDPNTIDLLIESSRFISCFEVKKKIEELKLF